MRPRARTVCAAVPARCAAARCPRAPHLRRPSRTAPSRRRTARSSAARAAAWSRNVRSAGMPAARQRSRTPSASRLARASRCCIPSGVPSPACSAIVWQFLRGSPASSPRTSARARRRDSTRQKRAPIRVISSSGTSSQRPGSTLWPAATRRSLPVVTNRDDQTVAALSPAPTRRRSRSTAGVLAHARRGGWGRCDIGRHPAHDCDLPCGAGARELWVRPLTDARQWGHSLTANDCEDGRVRRPAPRLS